MKRLLIFDLSDTLFSFTNQVCLIERSILEKLKEENILAMFTAAPKQEANEVVDKYYFGLFDIIIALEDVYQTKPDDEGLRKVMDKYLNLEVAFIGDSQNDFLAAFSADIAFMNPKCFQLFFK